MKKVACLFICLFAWLGQANATVIIDPNAGWSGEFIWNDGLGQIDGIGRGVGGGGGPSGFGADVDWSITAATDSTMSFTTAFDAYAAGDEFALLFDGGLLAWSSTSIDGSGYFHGVYDDLFLSAGTHTLSFSVTAIDGGSGGAAYAEFSGITPDAVPEPTSIALLGLGLAGIGFSRKKKVSS